MRSVAFCTLGCKVNQYETDAMKALFLQSGYEIVDFNGTADVYIVNTCTVTNIADKKSRQMLHRARKNNPDGIVAAVGCYVQAAAEALEKDPLIDVIIGNNKKKDIVAIVDQCMAEHKSVTQVIDINHTSEYETLHIDSVSEHTRAYIKIQDGCNQFCAYCIIPYARGRVRSRSREDVLTEARSLAANGYKEIVLTGIHISSYGLDFEGQEYNSHIDGSHLISLIEEIHKVDGIRRIRLGSLEPRIITEAFAGRLAALPKICPQFHLSLQSGCDSVLKRMNRKYTTQVFREGCRLLRQYFDRPAITTDIIVGFPGETDEEFEITRQFLEEIGFAQMHIFKYSIRKGTKAAAMEGQVSNKQKAARSDVLLTLNDRLRRRYIEALKDKPLEILIEERADVSGRQFMTGHSKEAVKVAFEDSKIPVNEIVSGNITCQFYEDFVICERMD